MFRRSCLIPRDVGEPADKVKFTFGNIVALSVENGVAIVYGSRKGNIFPRNSRIDAGDRKRLGEKSLQLSRAVDEEFIVRVEFVHAQNGDDILQFLIRCKVSITRFAVA